MPKILGISALTLATHNMARAVEFYLALGFDIKYGGSDVAFTSFNFGQQFLNIIAEQATRQWSWWGRVIFYVDNVDAFYAHTRAAGLDPEAEPTDAPWGERYFHITDPDGHELSFAQPLAKSN